MWRRGRVPGRAGHACAVREAQAFPGDEPQGLAVALGELGEGAQDRVALGECFGGVAADVSRDAVGFLALAGGRAPPVGELVAGDDIEPRQWIIRDLLEPPPGDGERLGGHVFGGRVVGAAAREAQHGGVVRAVEDFEALGGAHMDYTSRAGRC